MNEMTGTGIAREEGMSDFEKLRDVIEWPPALLRIDWARINEDVTRVSIKEINEAFEKVNKEITKDKNAP